MPSNLDIDLIRTFVAVVDHAGMTAAAGVRNLTQGAVSQQVKRLETTLGARLFDRQRHGVALTRQGEQLLAKARRLLALNDEIYADMKGAAMHSRLRLGVPFDLIGTCMAPILKTYATSSPEVELSLVCDSSPVLLEMLRKGKVDLAVVEEPLGPSDGECLSIDRLVWVGARHGKAKAREPLPVSMVAESCAFRPAVLSALEGHERGWRTVFENGNIEATIATVRADLAVTAWLACTVPADLAILGPEDGLPPLPHFAINLHLAKRARNDRAAELARYVCDGFMRRQAA